MKLDHPGFLSSLFFGHSKRNFALGTVPHHHSNRNSIISIDTSSVSLSYLIPACSSLMTWKKNFLSGSVSEAASAGAPTAAGASCEQFPPSSLFPPGCIRLMVEVRHSQRGHHTKRLHLADFPPREEVDVEKEVFPVFFNICSKNQRGF